MGLADSLGGRLTRPPPRPHANLQHQPFNIVPQGSPWGKQPAVCVNYLCTDLYVHPCVASRPPWRAIYGYFDLGALSTSHTHLDIVDST